MILILLNYFKIKINKFKMYINKKSYKYIYYWSITIFIISIIFYNLNNYLLNLLNLPNLVSNKKYIKILNTINQIPAPLQNFDKTEFNI